MDGSVNCQLDSYVTSSIAICVKGYVFNCQIDSSVFCDLKLVLYGGPLVCMVLLTASWTVKLCDFKYSHLREWLCI